MPLRWGIIGAGDVAEFKGGPALQRAPGSALVAVMRRDAQAAAAFATRMGVPRHYHRAADLLADPEVDAVYVATPVDSHHAYTLAAAAAGKHVLVEKPMALNTAQCHEMIAACRVAGVTLSVAYYRRFYPVVVRLRELVATGAIGQLVLARSLWGSFYPGAAEAWRTNPAVAGGGVLADIGSHRLDLLRYLVGPIGIVQAHTDTLVQPYAAEDSASLLLRFTNGTHGLFGMYWNMHTRIDQLELIGVEGRILVSDLEAGTVEIQRHDAPTRHESHPPLRPTHLGLVADFVQAVEQGRAPLVTGEEGAATTSVIEAAYGRDAGA